MKMFKKKRVFKAFFNDADRYSTLGKRFYVLFDDNSWEEFYIAFPLGYLMDEAQEATTKFRIQNLTQKKMTRDEVLEYMVNFCNELEKEQG